MGNLLKRSGAQVVGILLFTLVMANMISAAVPPEGWIPGNPKPGHNNNRVAEPAAVLLLGAGLVSLGVYARKKRNGKK